MQTLAFPLFMKILFCTYLIFIIIIVVVKKQLQQNQKPPSQTVIHKREEEEVLRPKKKLKQKVNLSLYLLYLGQRDIVTG